MAITINSDKAVIEKVFKNNMIYFMTAHLNEIGSSSCGNVIQEKKSN